MYFFRFLVFSLICLSVSQSLSSQVVVVPSTTKVTIDGRSFYLHTVQAGETLFSISRAYNVSQTDVIAHNPSAEAAIRIGEELKIPVPQVESEPPETVEYIRHITQQGQTVYWLTQHYSISQEELFRHNPELATSPLQAGQVVRIPQRVATPPETPRTTPDPPVITPDPPVIAPDPPEVPVISEVPDTLIVEMECLPTTKTEFRVAMLLPLFIDDNFPSSPPQASMSSNTQGAFSYSSGRFWINPRSINAIEFYSGAMMALDSLRTQGLNAKIEVYDTMRDMEKMTQLLDDQQMKEVDLIIGPFATELVDRVADFSRENGIYYVSPTAINAASLRNNPYFIQVNSGEINTVSTIVNHIAKKENIHITLISNSSETDQALFEAYHNQLKEKFSEDNLTVISMSLSSIQQPVRYLRRENMNIVIIPSADEAFVNIVTGQLNTASNRYNINVYGLGIWTKFVNLDLEYLHTLEFRYASAFYIDYDSRGVRNFLRKYRNLYHTEPTMATGIGALSPLQYQFAFLGYDVTYFFLSALMKFGEHIGPCISTYRMEMLQSDFHFNRLDQSSGYRNTHFEIYKYTKEYTIVKEEQ